MGHRSGDSVQSVSNIDDDSVVDDLDDETVDITELQSELFEAGDDFIGNSVANLRIFNVKKDVAEHST
jgi:hypothetical protein